MQRHSKGVLRGPVYLIYSLSIWVQQAPVQSLRTEVKEDFLASFKDSVFTGSEFREA